MKFKYPLILALFIGTLVGSVNLDFKKTNLASEPKHHFPKNFLFGAAIAEWQNSGSKNCPNCNWSVFETQKSSIANGQKSGASTDHWNKYKDDIKLMRKLGLNTFRFSVEWSKIEPEEGRFDTDALDHYEKECDDLISAGITPMITLHHFTNPLWFDYKGGFEKEENIEYFERFAKKVFARLGSKVSLWCTINEPAVYTYMGYFLGHFPPSKNVFKTGFELPARVLKNMLKAHVTTYKKLKSMPSGEDAKIGFAHNILKFKPRYNLEPIEVLLSSMFTKLTNDLTMEFLSTGNFDYRIPGLANVQYSDPDAPSSYDFFGLNYYASAVIGFNTDNIFGPTCFPGQVMGDMFLPIDPEGFRSALREGAALGVPVYVTENGIADAKDINRESFLKQFLTVLGEEIKRGVNIKGYYHWTLVDNFEWNQGRTKKFGLFNEDRKMRKSAQYYKDFIEVALA